MVFCFYLLYTWGHRPGGKAKTIKSLPGMDIQKRVSDMEPKQKTAFALISLHMACTAGISVLLNKG